MVPDVTDFRIEVLFAGANGGFPDERSIEVLGPQIDAAAQIVSFGDIVFHHPYPPRRYRFGMYWNVADAYAGPVYWSWDLVGQDPFFVFHSDVGMAERWAGVGGLPVDLDPWPRALRFSFKLYDRDRRYFPEGKRFEYIVKLPGRE